MECPDVIDQLIEHLLTREPREPAVPEELVSHIAGCRRCIEELDAISSVLTGEASTLREEADKLLTCQECLDALGAYVEDEVAGEDVAARYPRVERHLQSCSSCREQYDLLHELVQQEAAGAFGEAPSYMTFEEWFQRQEQAPLWQELARELRRLMTEIPIRVAETTASFGQLPPPLTPQLVPAAAYRNKELLPTAEEGEELIEVLELPHREANLVIRVRMGPVFDGKGTLVLEVSTIEPSQPIEQAKVTLRDEDGGLLEGAPTDEDGLASFRELDIGKYTIQVEHAGQTWEFGVTLTSVVD